MQKALPLRLWYLIRDVALLALLIFGARSVVADWNHVPSGSMKPTLLEGDLIFVNRLAYDLKVPFSTHHIAEWDHPARGDVVVFDSPADDRLLVKRIIGLPGDTVTMRGNTLLIDGRPVLYSAPAPEAVAALSGKDRARHLVASEQLPGRPHSMMVSRGARPLENFGPVRVPEGQYLMLGDNRDQSADSRYFGFVPRKAIRGRAVGIIASFDLERRFLPRGDRVFMPID